MSEKNFNLINIEDSKIIENAYNDILSNPGKKIGEALGTIINIGNTLLWPIKWANERTRIYFENNLKKYEEKLSKIENEKIVEVPTEISMPILERFTYVSNEEISNAFINLLTAASNVDTIKFAHPSFIQIIDRMSPDEAKIIKYFKNKIAVTYISLYKYKLESKTDENLIIENYEPKIDTSKYFSICQKKTKITDEIILDFPDNFNIYMDNLISLGLINNINTRLKIALEKEMDELEKKIEFEHQKYFSDIPPNLLNKSKKIEKGMYELSDFGKLFVKSCINN